MALLFALVALLIQPSAAPADFVAAIARCEVATVEPGTFVGCATTASDGERLYAGLLWIDGAAVFTTGP